MKVASPGRTQPRPSLVLKDGSQGPEEAGEGEGDGSSGSALLCSSVTIFPFPVTLDSAYCVCYKNFIFSAP